MSEESENVSELNPLNSEPNETSQPLNSDHVTQITIKIPPFWRQNVRVWLRQVDAQFITKGVTRELTKYYHVLGNLDTDVAALISDFLDKPLSHTPYQDLCHRLISEFEESENRKVTKLIDELELGSKRPTQFLREMRTLASNHVKDDFLKTLFLKHLPVHISAILASSSDSLDNLATMADKIMEYSPSQSHVYTMTSQLPKTSETDRLSRLEAQISQLTNEIASLRSRSRSRSRTRSSREITKSDSPQNNEKSLCWYHYKFGNDAKKCTTPCSYRSSPSVNSEN